VSNRPWDYASPREQARFHHAAELLDVVRGNTCFRKALEVGCAEGAFTEFLAPRCESLLAVDVSAAALERALTRRR